MGRDVVVSGGRDVRGSLDGPADALAVVVACPPHPRAGGTRSNPILTALGDGLADRGIATLRFDYGPWDDGEGEVSDAERAIEWAVERFDTVGAFGYSFGATVALAAAVDSPVTAVAALAPADRLPTVDTVATLERLRVPVLVVHGERDRTVDSIQVAERARALGQTVVAVPADHHFVGRRDRVAARLADFFADRLDGSVDG